MKIECRVCNKKKKAKNIFHFAGFIRGDFENDICVCKKCSTKYGYSFYFVNVPDAHIKGD